MRSSSLPLSIAAVALLAACGPTPRPGRDAATDAGGAAAYPLTQAGWVTPTDGGASPDPSPHSLYRFASTWTDQRGQPITLGDLAGRVQVVAMAYTRCSVACPALIARMKRLEAAVPPERRGGLGLVLVSMDPDHDTPDRLAAFAKDLRLDPERWTVLTGAPEDVRALSVLLGVSIQPLGNGEFAHGNVLTVLAPDGVTLERVEGLTSDLEPAIAAVRTALAAGSR
jgi:protein SCO1/2